MRDIPDLIYYLLPRLEGKISVGKADIGGVATAGIGHTGSDIVVGQEYDDAQIFSWEQQDVARARAKLYSVLTDDNVNPLSVHQWCALLSFAFNLGVNPAWTIWSVLKSGDLDKVPDQMKRFDKARIGGKLVAVRGLDNRRAAEVTVWNTPDSDPEGMLASAKAITDATPDAPPSSGATRAIDTPPTPTPMGEKPLAQSRTIWAGLITIAGGMAEVGKSVIDQASGFSQYSPIIAQGLGYVSLLVVGAGAAVVVLRFLDHKNGEV